MTRGDPTASVDARVDKSALMIPSIFLGLFAAMYLAAAIKEPSFRLPLAGIIALWGLLIAYLCAYRVVLSNGSFTKQTLFGRRQFALAEVKSASVRIGVVERLDVLRPFDWRSSQCEGGRSS